MAIWYRVFGTDARPPEPAALVEYLHGQRIDVAGRFRADDEGWFRAELTVAGVATPLEVDRYLASEEGIRAELNTWAAWLETAEDNPHHAGLMGHMIGTAQLFTLRLPDDPEQAAALGPVAVAVCRFLAAQTAGVYQVDGEGFRAADGSLLVAEHP